jgi:hypothetical protein
MDLSIPTVGSGLSWWVKKLWHLVTTSHDEHNVEYLVTLQVVNTWQGDTLQSQRSVLFPLCSKL